MFEIKCVLGRGEILQANRFLYSTYYYFNLTSDQTESNGGDVEHI